MSPPNRARLCPALVLALLAAVAACAEESGQSSDELPPPVDEARYVSEVDEAIGASVAILVDNSGSMEDVAEGDQRPKYLVARTAIEAMLQATDSFIAKEPDFPIKVGLYQFSTDAVQVVPIAPYNREVLQTALRNMATPEGGTAIGDAMDMARADLYRAGTYRKYILVITDGENNRGRDPEDVAREIARRSEGAVRQYFVAFDIDADRFQFLREVKGEVLGASNGMALRASLDTLYRGRILAEAVDAGETLPDSVKRATSRGR